MKAFVFRDPGVVRVEEVPEPSVRDPHDVLLRPLSVGICFTDKHAFDGWLHAAPQFRSGAIFGHEGSAVVVETGSDVTAVRAGDRVAILPVVGCGYCLSCRAGFGTRCLDGYTTSTGYETASSADDGSSTSAERWIPKMEAELFIAPEAACVPIPEGVSDHAGACVESFTCGMRAVRGSGVALADNVVVLGGCDYSHAVVQAAQRVGAANVVFADHLPVRRKVAERLGATVFDPTDPNFVAEVYELMPWGADQVFLAQENYIRASSHYFRQACELLRIQGTLNIVRVHSDDGFGPFPGYLPLIKEITIRNHGVFFGEEPARGGRERGDFQVAIDAIERADMDGAAHVTNVVEFDDVKNEKDLADIYGSLPEAQAKVLFKMPTGDCRQQNRVATVGALTVTDHL